MLRQTCYAKAAHRAQDHKSSAIPRLDSLQHGLSGRLLPDLVPHTDLVSYAR
jgi:hypothetical protein